MKGRDYLVNKGLAKPGRGKFSGAGREALADALRAGEVFEDYRLDNDILTKIVEPKPERKPRAPKPDKPKREPKAKSVDIYGETPPMVWPMTAKAIYTDTGKPLSMKEVCDTCKHSLYWNVCANPTVLGGKAVTLSL